MYTEYPRPQMERTQWQDLCGPWDYAITDSDQPPSSWDGKILVPFSPEAPASGVRRAVKPGDRLWYHREISFSGNGERFLLHFSAVDQTAEVWCNGKKIGGHRGGYTPFTLDVTDALDETCSGEILVCVRDDTEKSSLARGKQSRKSHGMWYTAQSGIWQPVWAEAVPAEHIRRLQITPLFDEAAVKIEVFPGGTIHFQGEAYPSPARIPVPDFIPWSPENPHLYEFTASLGADTVKSYFAMRKFSVENARLCLNGEPYFHNGVLDQGYNPIGLYTYPSDEAMIWDIRTAKEMGFNTIRKHMKIEPLRWYYHCDRLGMLVWQDMPCGGAGKYNPLAVNLPLITGISVTDDKYRLFRRDDEPGRQDFYGELSEMIQRLYNSPSVALWCPFNEGWGQFDAASVAMFIHSLDTTRTIDHASGWHDQLFGDTRSIHTYFFKYRHRADRRGRAVLLSEFGGYDLRVEGHAWNKRTFGYKRCKTTQELADRLQELYTEQIRPAREKGLSAAIYTQLTDVEEELNGLITYDREAIKLPLQAIRDIIS